MLHILTDERESLGSDLLPLTLVFESCELDRLYAGLDYRMVGSAVMNTIYPLKWDSDWGRAVFYAPLTSPPKPLPIGSLWLRVRRGSTVRSALTSVWTCPRSRSTPSKTGQLPVHFPP